MVVKARILEWVSVLKNRSWTDSESARKHRRYITHGSEVGMHRAGN